MAMIALYATWYNFVKPHKSIKTTPAVAAGIVDRQWEMADIVALIEAAEAPMPAGMSVARSA